MNQTSLQFRNIFLYALFIHSYSVSSGSLVSDRYRQKQVVRMVHCYSMRPWDNEKRETWLDHYELWTELCSLLYTDSAVNKLRLEKWVMLVLLFSSLYQLTVLSVSTLYGKSLTADWLHRKSTAEYQVVKRRKATHHTYTLIDWNCHPTSKCSSISILREVML